MIGLVLIVALTLLAALAQAASGQVWASYANYRSPYLAALPQDTPEPALTSRVIVVLVRGLRADQSRNIASLNRLRERDNSADITLELDPPLWRLPLLMTLFSGANAETHGAIAGQGLHTNLGANTIFLELQKRDKFSSVVGSDTWDRLFGSTLSLEYAMTDEQATQAAIGILNDPVLKASFVGIELNVNATSDTTNIAPQASNIDASLTRLLAALDLSKETLIVVSDRGTLSTSFRSTPPTEADEIAASRVPLIMTGAGIRSVRAAVKAQAFAPTLAILLGVPIPIHAQSVPILPALQLSGRGLSENADHSAAQITTFYENWATAIQQPRFAAELYQSQRARLREGGDARLLQNFEVELNYRRQTALNTRLRNDMIMRLPLLAGAILCAIGFIGLLISQRIWWPFFGVLVYAALWSVIFFYGRQDRLSFSMFPDAEPFSYLARVGRDNISIVLFVGLLVALMTARNTQQALFAVTDVLSSLALIVLAQTLVVVWFIWQWNYTFTHFLPDSRALMLVLIALTQISSLLQPIAGVNVPVPLALGALALLLSLGLKREPRPLY
ncbi:MAG: hypothetical protein KIH69_007055 [Anaerolineae bacterium]|nr:hypothetical protein [Anaerolineae bacterium]